MKITLTRRVDGSVRIGTYQAEHFATGLHYGDDEIDAIKVLDIPAAYETDLGYAYEDADGQGFPIWDHPEVRKQFEAWK